ncbi:glucose-6-phosphate dehydrogenase assembly protein OpcA [Corynebacteriaceae bacterium 6-324]
MITPMPNTTTSKIARGLVEAQEHYTLTTSRVLTLIVVVNVDDEVDAVLDSVRDASHEHPSRVLVVITGSRDAEPLLNAELRVGGEAGASEIVVMHLFGPLADNAESVVTPLLLPDTPIVVWWPTAAPEEPSKTPIGELGQRRITHAAAKGDLRRLSSGYAPGDTDMAWGEITQWRGIVASSLDRLPHEPVKRVEISGPSDSLAVDLAAAWMLDRLAVPVKRVVSDAPGEKFTIHSVRFFRETSDIIIEAAEEGSVRVNVPGSPESMVALNTRSRAEILSEELRHLDADEAYAHTLRGLAQVDY